MHTNEIKNISVVGAGYVGTSIAVMLGQKLNVKLIDTNQEKIEKINSGISPIRDSYIENYLKNHNLSLEASDDLTNDINNSQLIILCLPTDFNEINNSFDTTIIENVLDEIFSLNFKGICLIKSTVPIGFTMKMKKKYNSEKIYFSPEFLREGHALFDNLHPSRIIIGGIDKDAISLGKLIHEFALSDASIINMTSDEAEAVKLFSNTYLATRIAYFNELDTFCMQNNLDSKNVINGICLDPRIGNDYNNPSFGYGGYCLPKDSRQLNSQVDTSHNQIISASIRSNAARINKICEEILKISVNKVGLYRLIMKQGSDNFRESSSVKILEKLKSSNLSIQVYEPNIKEKEIYNIPIISDLDHFKKSSELIVSNRLDNDLLDVTHKVFTRDLFSIN